MKGKSITVNQNNIQSLVHKMIKQLRDVPRFEETYICAKCGKQAVMISAPPQCWCYYCLAEIYEKR